MFKRICSIRQIRILLAVASSLLAVVTLPSPVWAVLVQTGNGNTTAPIDDPGFANVGRFTSPSPQSRVGSVVYLGNRWIISANHVNVHSGSTVYLGGNPYSVQAGTVQQLTHINPNMLNVQSTDLKVMRLTSDPGLSSLAIRGSSPTLGSEVVMIGNGLGHISSPTPPNQLYWNVTFPDGDPEEEPWTWGDPVDESDPNNYSGFQGSSGTRAIRWGENEVHSTALFGNIGGGLNAFHFRTRFDDAALDYTDQAGLLHEAQALAGDSGGGVFIDNAGNWELAGIMVSIGTYPNQSTSNAVYGNITNIIDLSMYRDQILSIIPEPSSFVICWTAGLGFLLFARRFRNCAA